jgi:hypothetical protein
LTKQVAKGLIHGVNKLAVPVIILGASAFFMFADIWWVSVMALVACGLAVGLGEAENDRLRAELAQRDKAQAPGPDPQSPQEPQHGDAFLKELHRLSAPKSASGRRPRS